MKTKYSPSINIIRDKDHDFDYQVTPNAEKIAYQINDLYKKGFHSFNIIGSYGTGKSSFLWALNKSLTKEKDYFKLSVADKNDLDVVNIIGEHESLKNLLAEQFDINLKYKTSKEVLKQLTTKFSNDNLLVIIIDEFGKLLEYAVKNNVDEEIYFLQQLAEIINDPNNNCILITTLHQSFDAYGHFNLSDAERNEWRKVKGRFKDLAFNEPVEQLIFLAANKIDTHTDNFKSEVNKVLDLQAQYHIIKTDVKFISEVSDKLWPLDVLSAHLLCVALQRYGQNERSLFTFLESELGSISKHLENGEQIGIPEIYDYLYHEFYSYLTSKFNIDYSGWSLMAFAIDRIDADLPKDQKIAEDIIKVIGFISLLGHKGAHVGDDFLVEYLSYQYSKQSITNCLSELNRIKVIRFNRFSKSYKITQGTDLNIEDELLKVSGEIESKLDITHKLVEYFDFPVVSAKAISYKKGTPRFFQYIISEEPLGSLPNDYQIDGVINLVFDSNVNNEQIIDVSRNTDEIIYASFLNINEIRNSIYEIEKTQQVLNKNGEDPVAKKELKNILNSLRGLLNHQVLDALFTKNVVWYYKGGKVKINSKKELNKRLSLICEDVYPFCPTFKNELINRHHISGNISGSKKTLFKKLVSNYHSDDLGFSNDLFPPEKTIYLTLLKNTGIHKLVDGLYSLGKPSDKDFLELWGYCEMFIESAKNEKRKVSELYEYLSLKPFKLTSGFLEFWVPIFLFIKRDDFALFSKSEGYIPYLNESILYLFTRTAADYEIKSFDVQGIKLDLFNKYREFLLLKDTHKVNNKSLIESIKPFLVFHRDLNDYTKGTKRLSKETIYLRETIKNTQDPEKLFFEEFPKAMNFDIKEILKSDDQLEEYVNKLRGSIKELRSCYDELVNRIERFLVEEVLQGKDISFDIYKMQLMQRYNRLKEHMLLPNQTSLLIRLNSPLDDRNSWVNSICQVIVGKSLESIKDNEEEILKEKIKSSLYELDNLVSIADLHEDKVDQEVFKLQLTSFNKGMQEETIMIPKEVAQETEQKLQSLEKFLGRNKKMNLYLLMSILKKQLDD